MNNRLYHTAIDVGTSKVTTLIARTAENGEIQVIGMGSLPSRGVQKGLISNLSEVKQVIQGSLFEAQKQSGVKTNSAYVGITGSRVSYVNSRAAMDNRYYDTPVCEKDLQQVVTACYKENFLNGDRILHVIPRDYSVDGNWGIHNPVGMRASSVEVESHIVMTDPASADNLVEAMRLSGVKIKNLVLQPLASAEAVVSEDEKNIGVVMVDIGGGTSDISIFLNGSVWHINVIPVGGFQITRDISIAFSTFALAAEEAKLKYGNVFPDDIRADEDADIELPGFGNNSIVTVDRRNLCEVIKERIRELISLVLKELHEAGLDRAPSGGLVLTGGTSKIPGIRELASEIWPGPVRLGVPMSSSWVPQELEDPAYSGSLGLLYWGSKHCEKDVNNSYINQILNNNSLRLRRWINSFTSRIYA